MAASVSTQAGRDAMLRTAVQECLKAAGRRQAVSPVPPRELVCGLARSLGVPEHRTITIVHAAVAAEVRQVRALSPPTL